MTRSTRVLLALLGLISLFGTAVMHESRAHSLQAAPVAWMLFVDDMHLDFRNTGRLRTFARTVISELAEEGDLRNTDQRTVSSVHRFQRERRSATAAHETRRQRTSPE
jgi:hypothetical protein